MTGTFTDDQLLEFITKVSDSITNRIQHTSPSQKTKEMLEELDKKTNNLEKSLSSIDHKLDLHVSDFKHREESFKDFMDRHEKVQTETFREIKEQLKNLGDSKAGVWVERAIRWVLYTIVGAVVLSILALVVKQS